MKILIHDYSGHPFQVQLSRELSRRGHQVTHLYSDSFQTPKGNLQKTEFDPDSFNSIGLSLDEPFSKYTFLKRRKQEIQFGRIVAKHLLRIKPDIVISSNAPIDAQAEIQKAARANGSKFVFWVQDLYSEAIDRVLRRKLPGLGQLVGGWYRHLEYSLLRASDGIVVITPDFVDAIARYGIDRAKIDVVENWAPLDEMKPSPRNNDWAAKHNSANQVCLIYSGTLGYKHNPDILLELAANVNAAVFVLSEGKAVDELKRKAAAHGQTNLIIMPWADFAELPKILSSADILLAIIEEDAGVFSVPSKVLSYMCVGRPILAAIPEKNLAAQIIKRENAGLVSGPSEIEAFVSNAQTLIDNPELRDEMGRNARAYAERAFDIQRIGNHFETIIDRVSL